MKSELIKRFSKLPEDIQKMISEDMETAFENRVATQETILRK